MLHNYDCVLKTEPPCHPGVLKTSSKYTKFSRKVVQMGVEKRRKEGREGGREGGREARGVYGR